jgi:3-dehydroquinate synthase
MIHGEAVGIGLVQEADLAHHLGICERDVVARIQALVRRSGLTETIPKVSFRSLWEAMQHDKKVVSGKVIGVWPVRIGEVMIRALDRDACQAWYENPEKRPPGRRRRSSRQR